MAIGCNRMGKIEINYSECGNLAKNLEFVLDNIVKEKKSINNAIYILKNVKDNYGDIEDLNQCLENKIVSLNSEEEKVRSFIIDFKKYIQDISDVDNQLANDIRKKSKIYINNVIDIQKNSSDKLLYVEDHNEEVNVRDFNMSQGIEGLLYWIKGDERRALKSLTSVASFFGLISNGSCSISKCDKPSEILNMVDQDSIFENEISKLNLYRNKMKITREIKSMIKEGDIESIKSRVCKVIDLGDAYILKTFEGIYILCEKKVN